MKLELLAEQTYNLGNGVLDSVQNIIECEAYCAKVQVYVQYLKNKREEADLYLNNFREFNDKVFKQAMEILDVAIETANAELAENALLTISTLKDTYPDFYNSYQLKLLGKK